MHPRSKCCASTKFPNGNTLVQGHNACGQFDGCEEAETTLSPAVYTPHPQHKSWSNQTLPLASHFSYTTLPDDVREGRRRNNPQHEDSDKDLQEYRVLATEEPAAKYAPQPYAGRPLNYEGPYLGDPCTSKCLDHVLDCGHKIITPDLEPCAPNCHIREVPDLSQPKNLDSRFMCMACIASHLRCRQANRLAVYRAELEGFGETDAWVGQQLGFLMEAWQEQDMEEIMRITKDRRPCGALYIDPDDRGIFEQVMTVVMPARRPRLREISSASLTSASPVSSLAPPTSRQDYREQFHRGTLASRRPMPGLSPVPQPRNSVMSLFQARSVSTGGTASAQACHTEDEVWSVERSPPKSPASSCYS